MAENVHNAQPPPPPLLITLKKKLIYLFPIFLEHSTAITYFLWTELIYFCGLGGGGTFCYDIYLILDSEFVI